MILLARKPLIGARFLQRRLKDTNTRQVGPLTLHYFILLSTSAIIYYCFRFYLQTVKTTDNILAIVLNEEKTSLISYAVACLFGTIIVDITVRLAVTLGWPIHRSYPSRKTRETISNRRLRASYLLVMPVLICSVSMAIIVVIIALLTKNSETVNNYNSIIPPVMIAIALICIFIAYPYVSKFLDLVYKYKGPNGFTQFLLIPVKISLMVFLFSTIAITMYKSRIVVSDIYPIIDDQQRLSASKDIEMHDPICKLTPNRQIRMSVLIYNKGKGTAVIKQGSLALATSSLSGVSLPLKTVRDSKDESDILVISAGSAARKQIISDYGNINPSEYSKCYYFLSNLQNESLQIDAYLTNY